ncbi:hypothetical protein KC318_g1297 [Hortaea werneckii]|nr:hypothetical protein KC334_g3252 [Hortaea werneckii]KAI7195763.1 hypothetical protein KC324_g4614 [Hortaea werneckii]KAI7588302.1 hypothetical protein KC316_g4540 [Hortaea werneckii]KAI7674889.1 hypothetical protein KC318_g1297 [Hortaea werneckii]
MDHTNYGNKSLSPPPFPPRSAEPQLHIGCWLAVLDAAQPRAPGMGRYQSMRAYSRKDTYIDSSSSTTGLGSGWGTASHQLQLVSHVAVQDFHMSVDAADGWAASDSASGKVPYLRGCTGGCNWMDGRGGQPKFSQG